MSDSIRSLPLTDLSEDETDVPRACATFAEKESARSSHQMDQDAQIPRTI